jgi:hypothetical protein
MITAKLVAEIPADLKDQFVALLKNRRISLNLYMQKMIEKELTKTTKSKNVEQKSNNEADFDGMNEDDDFAHFDDFEKESQYKRSKKTSTDPKKSRFMNTSRMVRLGKKMPRKKPFRAAKPSSSKSTRPAGTLTGKNSAPKSRGFAGGARKSGGTKKPFKKRF